LISEAYPNKFIIMKQNKVLVIHQGALGDLILTFPAILELKKKYFQIDILCQNRLGRLMQYLNIADHAYSLESAAFATLFSDSPESKVKHLLRSYDTILLFSFSSGLEDRLNRILKHPVHRIPPRPIPGKRLHIAQYILDRLIHAGLIDVIHKNEGLPPPLPNNTAIPRQISNPYRILIHPGSGSPKKNWPLPRFMEVNNRLNSMGMNPVYILGPAEYHLQNELNRAGVKVRIIDDLIVLTKTLMYAVGFVGNDSGVTHLSAFLGLPTVVIFGPSDPKRWAPMGSHVLIVKPDEKNIECKPCFETPDVSCNTPECLINISPNQVLSALMEMISGAIGG